MFTLIWSSILVLGVLVFIHELGHFLAAKMFGVGVEKFSLGFGPRLFGRRVGITDYRVSAIPLGGYVKMVGDEPDLSDAERSPDGFYAQTVGRRMVIVIAGPLFNFLLAVFIFFCFFLAIGVEDITPVVRSMDADGPGRRAGVRIGDTVLAIDGRPIEAWGEVIEILEGSTGRPSTLTLRRAGEVLEIVVPPARKQGRDLLGDTVGYYDLGISGLPGIPAVVGDVTEGYPARDAGLLAGDHIAAVNGVAVADWAAMSAQIAGSGGQRLTLDLRRGEASLQVEVVPRRVQEKNARGEEVERYLIGISAPPVEIPPEERVTRRYGVWQSTLRSLERTRMILDVIVRSIGKMIAGSISLDNLGGPIMIAQLAADQAEEGLGDLVQFIAFMSINLGLINILPIPVLDGGHLLFFTIEAVRRKRENQRVREVAQQVGAFILLLFMVFVIYQDIVR